MAPHRKLPKALRTGLAALVLAALAAPPAPAQSRRVMVIDAPSQTVTARPGQMLDLVFRDGTSLLAGPGSVLTITQSAERIVLTGNPAALRIASGQPGRARPVEVRTGDALLRLTEGSAVIVADGAGTRAHLLIGGRMSVTASGGTRQVYRPGFAVTASTAGISRPRRLDRAGIVADLERIAPGLGRSPLAHAPGTARLNWPRRVQVTQVPVSASAGVPLIATLVADGEAEEGSGGACGSGAGDESAAGADCLWQAGLSPGDIHRSDFERVGPEPDPESVRENASFTDGLGSLGLGALYAGANNSLAAVAESSTSISDGSEADTFQNMSGAFTYSVDNGNVVEVFSSEFAQDAGIPGGVGPRRFGPTANTFSTTGSWDSIGTPGAPDPLSRSEFEDNGGLSYLLGVPGLALNRERVLLLRRRDRDSSNLSGRYAFHRIIAFPGANPDIQYERFTALSVRQEYEVDEVGTVFSTGDADDWMAFGLSFGDHLLRARREDDNFLFIEAVKARQERFDPVPGVASSAPVLELIGDLPPQFVIREFVDILDDTDLEFPFDTEQVYQVTIPDLQSPRTLIFAAGDLDGLLLSTPTGDPDAPFQIESWYDHSAVSVDRFQITPGVMNWFGAPHEVSNVLTDIVLPNPDAEVRRTSGRAFLRSETWTDLGNPDHTLSVADLTDRGAYHVYPAAPLVDLAALAETVPGNVVAPGAASTLLHADFGLAWVGERQQVSSLSATIGSVTFRTFVEEFHGGPDVEGNPLSDLSVDAVIRARTVGSSSAGAASTLMFTDWVSTASGGGNRNVVDQSLDFFDPKIWNPGRLGAFVLENAGTVFDDIASPDPMTLSGGLERPLGVAADRPDQAFGAVRLGLAATAGVPPDRAPGRFGSGLVGYANGWVEVETGGGAGVGLAPFMRVASGPNLTVNAPALTATTISGSLRFDGKPIALGGTANVDGRQVARGAFVDDLTWGMLSTGEGTQIALISAEPIARELRGAFHTAQGAEIPVPARDSVGKLGGGVDDAYDYAQWGVFFGDVMTEDGNRRHVHLGSFAAGSPIPEAVLNTARGEATYRGHAIGNVYDKGAVRTAVGTFSETFNFNEKARKGVTSMNFDRQRYSGESRLSGVTYASTIAGGGRTGELRGRFVGGMSGGQPNALLGGFEIQNSASDPRAAYRASGTFVGEK